MLQPLQPVSARHARGSSNVMPPATARISRDDHPCIILAAYMISITGMVSNSITETMPARLMKVMSSIRNASKLIAEFTTRSLKWASTRRNMTYPIASITPGTRYFQIPFPLHGLLNLSLLNVNRIPERTSMPRSRTCPTVGINLPADQLNGENSPVEVTERGNPVRRMTPYTARSAANAKTIPDGVLDFMSICRATRSTSLTRRKRTISHNSAGMARNMVLGFVSGKIRPK